MPGRHQQRGQREPRPHAPDQQAATQVSGNGPGGPGRPRPAAASGDHNDKRGPPGYSRDARQNVGQRGPDRRGQGQQHDGGHHGLDDLTAQPFPPHGAHRLRDVSSAPALRHRPVHVAENSAGQHGVEEQRTVVGARRAEQADVGAERARHDPPPPGRTERGQGSERDGGHDPLPGDRTHPGLERRGAQLPPEKPQHGDAGEQTQQRTAAMTDGRTELGRN